MKITKKIVTLFLALALCLNIGNMNVKAAGASVTIALSASTVSIGSSVTATVTVSGSDVSQYDIYVTYNSSVLQFVSGSGAAQANGSGGTIRLVGGTGSTSLNFTAIANGSCYISTSGSEVYNINYEQIAITHAGANVTVATAESTESPTTSETGEQTSTTEEEDSRSSNCNLASLQVSPGTLDPAFSASKTSYFVQLEEDVTSIVVSATTEDEKASTSVSGADKLQKGENIVKVTVTAENGAVKIYSIRVAVGEILEDAEVTIDGETYRFVNDATELEVPERFSATTIQYQDWEIMAYESPNKKIILVCLYDEDFDYTWFVYDQDADSFIPYCEYSSSFNRYIILPVPAGIPIPNGYVETELDLQGNKVTAYQSENVADEDIYLVYAMNIDGDEGFYLYDAKEGAFIRYVPEQLTEEETETATVLDATPLDAPGDDDEGFFTREILFYIICGIGALCLLFLILTIVFAVKRKNVKQELEQAEDMIAHLTAEKDSIDKHVEEQSEAPVESPMVDIKDTTPTERDGQIDVIPIVKAESDGNVEKDSVREDKQSAYDEFEKQSELINHKIKEDYDISLDSAFADEPSETPDTDSQTDEK